MSKADKFVNKFLDLYTQQAKTSSGIYMEDPTVFGFMLHFNFGYVPAHSYRDDSPLFSLKPGSDSAVLYLESIGEKTRADKLRDFIDRLQLLVNDTPHYFQSIDGMENINKFDPHVPFRAMERKLTITTLESIDTRISTMFARYIDAVYDFTYHRQVVPENLLYFNCHVKFTEIRNFRQIANALATNENVSSSTAVDNNARYKLLNDNLSIFDYNLQLCKFNFDDAYAWMSSVDNKGGDFATGKFGIDVGIINENHNNLSFLKLAAGSVPESPIPMPDNITISTSVPDPGKFDLGGVGITKGFPTNILDRAKATAQFVEQEILAKGQLIQNNFNLKTLALRALNDAFDQLDSRIKGFILGNVFSPLNQLLKNDFYTSVKQFVENVINGTPVKIAATQAFGPNPPDHITTAINQLGQIATAYISQNQSALGSVAGFDKDPLKALETAILAGSLGNVFKDGGG